MLYVKEITRRWGVSTMRRNRIQQLGDMVGLYAYLTAVGGLRYWPGIRHLILEEQVLPKSEETNGRASRLQDTMPLDLEREREKVAGY